MSIEATTHFASAERASDAEIAEVAHRIQDDPLVRAVLEAVDGDLLILNEHRQVLAANASFLARLGQSDPRGLLGARPGEVLACAQLGDAPSGCGTGLPCRSCGAVLAIVASQHSGEASVRECLLTFGEGGTQAGEFRVRATPLRIGGQQLTAFVLHDVSAEKRRDVLERLFLHDMMNTVGGLIGWGSLLEGDTVDAQEAATQIVALSERLAREVRAHQTVLLAEAGELAVRPEPVTPRALLAQLSATFTGTRLTHTVLLRIEAVEDNTSFPTDPAIALRVLTNMVKNALEATPVGGVVRVSYARVGADPTFTCHNPGAMADTTARQVFKRSFTTKGQGRGLGTFSMKLLGERYLGGRVSFETDREDGTTFTLALPAAGPPAQPLPGA